MSSSISTAVSHDSLHIPLIDFSTFLSPTTDAETKLTTARAILEGFQTAGFIYLRNHGIPKPVVQKTFQQSAEFFKRPLSQKDALAWTTPEANRGYVAQGREKVTDATDAAEIEELRAAEGEDLKESLEIGREGEKDHPNHWPEVEGEEFKESMLDFFDKCKDLHVQVMRAIAVGLGIEETWFDSYCDKGDNTLRFVLEFARCLKTICLPVTNRLLHYPPCPTSEFKRNEKRVRAGAHTDYGKSPTNTSHPSH
jgi:isopenicillin N synthase-like dioxygenase